MGTEPRSSHDAQCLDLGFTQAVEPFVDELGFAVPEQLFEVYGGVVCAGPTLSEQVVCMVFSRDGWEHRSQGDGAPRWKWLAGRIRAGQVTTATPGMAGASLQEAGEP